MTVPPEESRFDSDSMGKLASVQVGPHEWKPLTKRETTWCEACYVPREKHPVTGWVTARPIAGPRQLSWPEFCLVLGAALAVIFVLLGLIWW